MNPQTPADHKSEFACRAPTEHLLCGCGSFLRVLKGFGTARELQNKSRIDTAIADSGASFPPPHEDNQVNGSNARKYEELQCFFFFCHFY